MIAVERLKEVLHYDPDTGVFLWREAVAVRVKPGDIAGCQYANGYRSIRIDGVPYKAHRLAWLYMTGGWPKGQIDHRDGDPRNNKFDNLREATQSENQQNRKAATKRNGCGLLGVNWHKATRKWVAQIRLEGRTKHLGLFADPRSAHEAYLAAKQSLHPFSTLGAQL